MWIVMQIGCLECDSESKIIGVFYTEERATELRDKCRGGYESREIAFEVFKLPPPTFIDPEYDLSDPKPRA